MKAYRVSITSDGFIETPIIDCPECEGKGWVWCEPSSWGFCSGHQYGDLQDDQASCDECGGKGYVDDDELEDCEDASND